jgi:hypothetical protein
MRKVHCETIKKREHFQCKNELLKARALAHEKEESRMEKLYMQMYFWCFLIKLYKIMISIQERYERQKVIANQNFLRLMSVQRIQRKFRFIMRFMSNPLSRARKTANQIMHLRTFWIRGKVRDDAKELISEMF